MYCDQCGQPLSDQSTRCPACDTADPAISPPLRFPTPTSALVADPYQPLPGLAPLMPVDDPGFQPEERSGLSPSQIRGLRRLTSLGLADPCRVLLTGDGNAPEATMVVAMLARAADDRRFRTELVSAIATRDFGSVLRHLESDDRPNPAAVPADPALQQGAQIDHAEAQADAESVQEDVPPRLCDACGSTLIPDARFCEACGRSLPSPLPASQPSATGAPVRAAVALTSAREPLSAAARTPNSRSCPNAECQAYRAPTSDGFCANCGTATVDAPITAGALTATAAARGGFPPNVAYPSPRPAGAPLRRPRYSNARRISYSCLWAFYTVVFVIGFFAAAAQGDAGGALVSLAIAAATGTYVWRIWTYRSKHLWMVIFF